jgi:3-methylcrotonyl-CoA carboxylase alpha subunit
MAAGLVWIGPPPAAIRAMGLKDAAKSLMIAGRRALSPPATSARTSRWSASQAEADAIGYPVLIKAVAGGGGKGMRKVDAAERLLADGPRLVPARGQASSFGDDRAC